MHHNHTNHNGDENSLLVYCQPTLHSLSLDSPGTMGLQTLLRECVHTNWKT